MPPLQYVLTVPKQTNKHQFSEQLSKADNLKTNELSKGI